jgi:hypothetical protein
VKVHDEILQYTFADPGGVAKFVQLKPAPDQSVAFYGDSNDQLKLRDKLREALVGSDFNAGVAIAESSKSFGLITNSATRIYLALKAVRSGRVGDAAIILTRNTAREGKFKPPRDSRGNTDKWGGLWLELQYGWLPLLKDAESAAKSMAHAFSVPPKQIYRVGRRVPGIFSKATITRGSEWAYTQYNLKAIIREKNMPQLLGLMDPASIAWELTPYSFVVDWFIPIGNYLQNLALARGIEGTFVETEYRRCESIQHEMFSVGYPAKWHGITYHYQFGSVIRNVSTSLSVPMPKYVGIDKALSVKHCMNAIALLTQLPMKWAAGQAG